MITEDNYDEILRLLQEYLQEPFNYPEDSVRLCIASGEDFDYALLDEVPYGQHPN